MKKGMWFVAAAMTFVLVSPASAGAVVDAGNVPNLLEFLPPPPIAGDADFQRDQRIYCETRSERGGEAWARAVYDAEDKKHLDDLYLDAFGVRITRESTPATHELLLIATDYIAKAINPAKEHYMRVRPYAYFNMPCATCTPHDEAWLRDNGSYPSGHSSRGWGLALVLTEISPERQGAILKRGYELGQSRVICGVHWQSDVDAARLGASAAVVQLNNDENFRALLEKAKQEIRELRQESN